MMTTYVVKAARRVLLAGSIALLSSGAFAQQLSDGDYCQELASLYRMFVRGTTPNAAGAAAMNECDRGNFTVGITRLEELLNARRVPLPPRK